MWRNVVVQAAYQILVLVVMLYSVPYWYPNCSYNLVETDFYTPSEASFNMKRHYTIMYNTFVMMTLANQISCRKLGWSDMRLHEHLFNNKWFIIVVAAELGVQALIIEFSLFNEIFRTTHLEWSMHFTCWAFGIGSFAVNLLAKKVFDQENDYSKYFKFNFKEVPEEQNNKIFAIQGKLLSKMEKKQDLDSSLYSNTECLLDHNEEDGHNDQYEPDEA